MHGGGRPRHARRTRRSGTADDAKWAAVFLANFHFAWAGTNYLAAGLPPSPLQNYWTLSVEEQFYLVFPTLFLVVASLRTRIGLRSRMLVVLGVLSVCSLGWSVLQTQNNPSYAYFSPFTRAWELALGAMVALAAPYLRKLPGAVASTLTWCGLGAILLAGVVYDSQTPYPGILVAVPVLGAALVVAGGTANPLRGAEMLLGLRPFRWLGRLSYSMYLWHWPILILAAESRGQSSLSVRSNLLLLLLALALAAATYRLVENPIRHSSWLRLHRRASIGLGVALVAATLIAANIEIELAGQTSQITSTGRFVSTGDAATVTRLVRTAPGITSLPTALQPSLDAPSIGYPAASSCWPIGYSQTTMRPCLAGDPHGSRTMVLYGDSHSAMWFQNLDTIATDAHWRLWYLGKSACPVELLPMVNPGGFGSDGGTFTQCDQWHVNAVAAINRIRPELVLVSQEVHVGPEYRTYSEREWRTGLTNFFSSITAPNVQFDVIGNIPQLSADPPSCLRAHSSDVQACSVSHARALSPYAGAEAEAVNAVGGRYVDVTPWFCSTVCTAVVGHYQVYFNQQHVMGPYATFLEGVMADALRLPAANDGDWHPTTRVVFPTAGSIVHGSGLVLSATSSAGTDGRVEFIISGHGHHDTVISQARRSELGWLGLWDSSNFPNGTYTLQSRVDVGGGTAGVSPPVQITVRN